MLKPRTSSARWTTVREKAAAAGVQAVVMMSGEHFSNFFYDNLPQIVIGLGEGHIGPRRSG